MGLVTDFAVVSIHAPSEGSDAMIPAAVKQAGSFNPRSQ